MTMEHPQGAFLDVCEIAPFLSRDYIQNLCEAVAQCVQEIWVGDFPGAAIAAVSEPKSAVKHHPLRLIVWGVRV